MSEDVPDPANRILLAPYGGIRVHWRPHHLAPHERLMAAAKRMLRQAGSWVLLPHRMGIETNSHQCGTIRFGHDLVCRAHDLANLDVVDRGFFPSSTPVTPALTIAAQAMRVADHLMVTAAAWPSGATPKMREDSERNVILSF